jgi:Pyruvate/2-oxoacid:ferredoxin oxidoreductase delta subunit
MRKLRDQLIRPSTRAWVEEARRTEDSSLFDLIHGYVYGRWPYLYIGIGTGEHPLARLLGPVARWLLKVLPGPSSEVTFADTYHGKVVPLESATQLVTVDQPVELRDLEQIIPYARARDIMLHNPDQIVALDCPCRAVRSDPCEPLDVCLIVGEPFASFVGEHHPDRSRRVTQDEAVEILQAEAERGHVHHAFLKDAMLNRFYAICNCCACCCGAMQAHRSGTPMLASSGYVGQVNAGRCTGCGTCVEFCQFEAIAMHDGRAEVTVEDCMGCGVCVAKCSRGAISLVRDPERGMPLEIEALLEG